jgi:matrix metalloproteinase-14 (membrane-inserted)
VKSFQSFAGLNVTGDVNYETLKVMSLPRCGGLDITENSSGVENDERRKGSETGLKDNTAKRSRRYILQGITVLTQ